MLGDKFAEESGQIIGTRLLSTTPTPKMEVTYQGQGRIKGVDYGVVATYTAQLRPDGTLYGEGEGVLNTAEGPLTWRGSGVGKPTGAGRGASWRGAVSFYSTIERFADLNQIAAIFEFEATDEGKTTGSLWEWK